MRQGREVLNVLLYFACRKVVTSECLISRHICPSFHLVNGLAYAIFHEILILINIICIIKIIFKTVSKILETEQQESQINIGTGNSILII
jgi:hypothetical protein